MSDRFVDPGMDYKPEIRWWLTEGSHTDQTLIESIHELYDAGFGAVEFVTLDESAYLDDATYVWGSEEWIHDSHLIVEECTKLGMGVSFTSGIDSITRSSVSIEEFEVYFNDSENLALDREVLGDIVTNGNDAGGKAYFLKTNPTASLQNAIDDALSVYHVEFEPDITTSNRHLSYIHKFNYDRDVFFIANSSSNEIDSYVDIRGKNPSIWNPHTGSKETPEYSYHVEDGQIVTRVSLKIQPVQSLFIIDEPAFEITAPEAVMINVAGILRSVIFAGSASHSYF